MLIKNLFNKLFNTKSIKVYKISKGKPIIVKSRINKDNWTASTTQWSKHKDFPKYCLNPYGMRRKVYPDTENRLYYIDENKMIYLEV